jgi:Fe-S oxidoreductase
VVPGEAVCCGRPLYDYGLLPLAKRMLLQTLETLREPIRAGLPIVVLEPSCAAVFRDEMTNLIPGNDEAERLKGQTHLLGEFIRQHRERFPLPQTTDSVLFHAHCHQKALFVTREDVELLKSLGMTVSAPDSGCCGMAGSFGFEADHYDISMQVGERVLLPAVRKAGEDAVILADGFSCREQIAQGTPRQAVHLAQLLRMAQRQAPRIPRPERALVVDHARETAAALPAYAAAGLIAIGAGLIVRGWLGASRRRKMGELL